MIEDSSHHRSNNEDTGEPFAFDDRKHPDYIEAFFDVERAALRDGGRETDRPDMTERRNQKVTDFCRPLPFVEFDAVHGRHRPKACQSGLWNACRSAGVDD